MKRIHDVQIDYRFPSVHVWSNLGKEPEEYFAQGEEADALLETIESMDGATLASVARLLGQDDVTDADLVVYLLGL